MLPRFTSEKYCKIFLIFSQSDCNGSDSSCQSNLKHKGELGGMSFTGMWSGKSTGSVNANVIMKIEGESDNLAGFALVNGEDGHDDMLEFIGQETEENKAKFELINYISGNINMIMPKKMNITLALSENSNNLEGNWTTEIGTKGTVSFKRANAYWKLYLSLPSVIYLKYLKFKRFLKLNFRGLYLAFVVLIALLSISGITKTKINIIEALILIIPLLYLFSDKLLQLLQQVNSLGLTKLGPLEFREQSKLPSNFEGNKFASQLLEKYGNHAFLYYYLSSFFVVRTKNLLRELSMLTEPLDMNALYELARKQEIPEENIPQTIWALLQTECIKVLEDGHIAATDLGREYLTFQSILDLYTNT